VCNTTDIYLCQCERDLIIPGVGICDECLYDNGIEPIDIDGKKCRLCLHFLSTLSTLVDM